MDRLVSIPVRVLGRSCGGGELTPVSPDVFISIPARVLASLELCALETPHLQRYHAPASLDLFDVK
jgi:hypothetical protein